MIGFLRGRVIEQTFESVTMDVNGVGYELCCSTQTLDDLLFQGDAKQESQVWVFTHLREDALALYGFSTPFEKKMFLSLLKVNGIGPKMAIKILSATQLSQLVAMIDEGNVKGLSSLPKVGKKTAEQLILTLKGQLVLDESDKGKKTKAGGLVGVQAEIISALVNLGFRAGDVEKVVETMPKDIDLQQGIRKGLQSLSGQV